MCIRDYARSERSQGIPYISTNDMQIDEIASALNDLGIHLCLGTVPIRIEGFITQRLFIFVRNIRNIGLEMTRSPVEAASEVLERLTGGEAPSCYICDSDYHEEPDPDFDSAEEVGFQEVET